MIGDMGKPGGGVGFGYTITNYLGNNVFRTYAPLPQGRNAVADFIPVARVSDTLARASSLTMTDSNISIPTLILSGPVAIRFTIIRIWRVRWPGRSHRR